MRTAAQEATGPTVPRGGQSKDGRAALGALRVGQSASGARRAQDSVRTKVLLAAPLVFAILDTVVAYLIANTFRPVRVGLLVAAVLGLVVLLRGPNRLVLPDRWAGLLVVCVFSLLFGVATIPEFGWSQIIKILGLPIYFLCGYMFSRWIDDEAFVRRVFLVTGVIAIAVCLAALSGRWPGMFPLKEALWVKGGVLSARPEITTDQNFQVFALIPIAMGVILAQKMRDLFVFLLLAIASAYTLSQLQTRSGILVFGGIIVLGLLAGIRNESIGRGKLALVPAIVVIGLVLMWDSVSSLAGALIYRFTDHGFDTAVGRVVSLTYFFEKVINVSWWIPRGDADFRALYGSYPHSNITAFFLEGGMLGALSWAALIGYPTLALLRRMWRGGMDAVSVAIVCGATGVLVLQLSLNVATHSQVWVWMGVVIGLLVRLAANDRAKRVRALRASQEGC